MSALDRSNGTTPSRGSFRLDKARGKFMGVSAGMADYFGWDVTLVRIGWVAGTLLGFGSLILIYLAIGLIAD
ncbi:MAG: PspC domain-containing protein [Proteobacteria bacterium]|nr:PspC domain-containing protein [Pseudomonadota bacterium]